jgi:aryl sulfotransferase
MDSTLWDDFQFREGDVIIATYAKAGTTWTQQIVGQLIFAGDPSVSIQEISPWWDMRIMPPEVRDMVNAQTHRRVVKTHLQADALPISSKAKYIYVARDGRDVIWSMYNHHAGFLPEVYDLFNGPGLVGEKMYPPDPDIRRYFNTWLERDGYPFWSFWDNTASWWALRHQPNVKLVHFANLKADLEGQMREIAEFLGIELADDVWPRAVRHCTFEHMKANAAQHAPMGGAFWEGGGDTFINKGVNGRWKDVLSPQESLAYERTAIEKLGSACAHWLMTGEG